MFEDLDITVDALYMPCLYFTINCVYSVQYKFFYLHAPGILGSDIGGAKDRLGH